MVDTLEDSATSPSLSGLKADVQQLRSDMAQLIETLTRTAKDATAGAVYDAATVPSEKLDQLSLCIQKQPIKSVAIAAGVGAFLGLVFLR